MFRDLRRIAQKLSNAENIEILQQQNTGILAVIGDGGYPYTVPLNFVYESGNIFIHCAKQGHKIDAISKESKVSFCVVAKDDVNAPKFSTDYKSVVVFGKATLLESDDEKIDVLTKIVQKYSPQFTQQGKKEIDEFISQTAIIKIEIEHITGKRSK
ncbi:MAG: pyridoxamine 5'-phosphate oxidase family protein [Oscillospiraceae bacterium]|nr:pyridoxamine 5'-phosphate oxidase family protein [Oscillospiraceae bacterium]